MTTGNSPAANRRRVNAAVRAGRHFDPGHACSDRNLKRAGASTLDDDAVLRGRPGVEATELGLGRERQGLGENDVGLAATFLGRRSKFSIEYAGEPYSSTASR